MYLATTFHILAFYLFFLPAHAIPIKPLERLAHQKRATYSVVAVDGGLPLPLSATTKPIIQTVIQTIDDTKTVTALPSTFTSSLKATTSIREPIVPKPVTATPIMTSVSTSGTTTVELKSLLPAVTQHAAQFNRPTALFHVVNPAGEINDPPEESSSRQIPVLSVASKTEIASATSTNPLPSLRSSITSYQALRPSSTAYSSPSVIGSASFAPGSWHSAHPYSNNTSTNAGLPCKTAASTGTATIPKLMP